MKNIWSLVLVLSFPFYLNSQSFINANSEHGITDAFGTGRFGGGLSMADFDNDGWDDLTIATQNGDSIIFYKNNYGKFERIASLVGSLCHQKSVIWADLDNDGDKDFLVTCYEDTNRMYRNDGNMQMVDITNISGLVMETAPTYGATVGDYDMDGLLDIYLGSYYVDMYPNRLYKNTGGLTFTDGTIAAGIFRPSSLTFQAHFFDYNNNMLPDLYLANDKLFENVLFENTGVETFTDVSAASGSNIIIDAMNSSSGDIDNDGDLDLYVTNTSSGNVLLRNNGDETFTDITNASGTGFFRVGWATTFLDFDNDGDLDMYVCTMSQTQPNALYVNQGNNVFTEPLFMTDGLGGDDIQISHCNVTGDFNHDGNLDLVVSNESDQEIRLWRNANTTQNWIKVRLKGVTSNTMAIGSWIEVHAAGNTYFRYTYCGDGYLGQNSDYTHFGIGNTTNIDSLVIKWPSGLRETYFDLDALQAIVVTEGQSIINPSPCAVVRYDPDLDDVASLEASSLLRVGGTSTKDIILSSPVVEVLTETTIPAGKSLLIYNTGCM